MYQPKKSLNSRRISSQKYIAIIQKYLVFKCKWSRKGFMRTRWNLNGTVFDLINIHLFHDASNFVAMETFPSVYSKTRQRALEYTLERFHNDQHGTAPFFLFGDFNFRTDTRGVINRLCEGLNEVKTEQENGCSNKVEYRDAESRAILTLGKKEFCHLEHQAVFLDQTWLREYDRELEGFCGQLFEYPIEFPPSYPFVEDSKVSSDYMKTRCPAWCDRVVLSETARPLVLTEGLLEYGLIGRDSCMGDHKVQKKFTFLNDFTELRVYLGETLAREKLCSTAEEQRQRLLARLGGQPPPPGYIVGGSPSPPPAYIDMSRSSTLTSTINSSKSDLNCYELMSDCTPTFIPNNLNTGGKSGRLGRRERFLFVGQTKKCWGTLLTVPQPQLHLYGHQGDAKAHTNLQLDGYQARPLASNTATTNKIETTNKTNNHQLSTFEIFCPGKKTYQFTAESVTEMTSWVEAINEACLRHKRQLPCVPHGYSVPQAPPMPAQELYDTPDSRVRPVTPTSQKHMQQDYERMQDSLYHIIDDKRRPKQEQLYKNVGVEDEDETCYYNLVPRAVEDIYQTITETDKTITTNPNIRTAPQNRIQAIIQAMEASIAEAQLYEPVDTSQELSR
ncbi:inositol polyphosphate-5-phosphatase A isoform X3 [Rhodnius prolixus]|uniref:inositol polyphosphate-5-phosphatase A isoform X3 n=1 Tax=Rhodnius prolixus TaxID=13249 RepID=UPI003D18846F